MLGFFFSCSCNRSIKFQKIAEKDKHKVRLHEWFVRKVPGLASQRMYFKSNLQTINKISFSLCLTNLFSGLLCALSCYNAAHFSCTEWSKCGIKLEFGRYLFRRHSWNFSSTSRMLCGASVVQMYISMTYSIFEENQTEKVKERNERSRDTLQRDYETRGTTDMHLTHVEMEEKRQQTLKYQVWNQPDCIRTDL